MAWQAGGGIWLVPLKAGVRVQVPQHESAQFRGRPRRVKISMPQEENIQTRESKYLNSPKEFHLEMPLYLDFDLSVESIADKVYDNLSNRDVIDAYCIWCEKESVFHAYNYLSDNTSVPSWVNRHDGLIEIEYQCTRDRSHSYHSYYFKKENFIAKVGQFPSVADFQIPQAEKYRKILGEGLYKELTRGIGLSANGVGIGSFVYLRRIFENLIEEAHAKALSEIKDFPDTDYAKAKMDEKIKLLKNYLTEFLVENRSLYSILSKGVHALKEEECLEYFESVRIGIEQILDEKIEKIEKARKADMAREAVQSVLSKTST